MLDDKLQGAWLVMRQCLDSTGELWRDAVRQQFEREFWQEFEQVVPATLEEMRRLGEVIAQARREVH
jgi:hypothetical protein